MKCYKTYTNSTHLILGMSQHYLGKLEIRIFCRYSAHMEENANCIFIASNSVIHPQILIFLVFKIPRFPHTDCK